MEEDVLRQHANEKNKEKEDEIWIEQTLLAAEKERIENKRSHGGSYSGGRGNQWQRSRGFHGSTTRGRGSGNIGHQISQPNFSLPNNTSVAFKEIGSNSRAHYGSKNVEDQAGGHENVLGYPINNPF